MRLESHPSIHFSDERYEELKKTYRRWWAGELDRPIVPVITTGHPSHRKPSPYPLLSFTSAWDEAITERQLVDARDWELSQSRFHGEAYPFMPFTPFGAGAMAAFLGCTPLPSRHTVWFVPMDGEGRTDYKPIEQLHFEFDENNPYFRRVINLYDAALEKWGGTVVLGMVDLGGVMDVLASFRGSENLLMDLYDAPKEVKRCVNEIKTVWFQYYNRILSMLAPTARGYSQWFNVFGEKPSYILQSDFSYMISPKMFGEFVAPELAWSSAKLDHTLYHMDGAGQVAHLEQLLAIEGIHGIQWVPGVGASEFQNWDHVLSRILASGKKLVSWNQNADGSPAEAAKDHLGQLFFFERLFGPEAYGEASAYGDMYGVEVRV